MLLMLDYGIFYEFIPMDQYYAGSRDAIPISEVELGKNYAVVISTNGGYGGHLIGDTVMFTSLHPYRIKISGRTKHYINAFGEELMIDNVETALKITCENLDVTISDYTGAPVFMTNSSKGRHEWF